MSSDDRVYLNDIWKRMERIEIYTRGGKAEFFDSLLVQDGGFRSLTHPTTTTRFLKTSCCFSAR